MESEIFCSQYYNDVLKLAFMYMPSQGMRNFTSSGGNKWTISLSENWGEKRLIEAEFTKRLAGHFNSWT